MGVIAEGNVGLAFLLTFLAGMSTIFGAAMPYFGHPRFPFLNRFAFLKSDKFLAASLGIAAGVMLYISFTEILSKTKLALEESFASDHTLLVSSCFFFSGMVICALIDKLVHMFTPDEFHSHHFRADSYKEPFNSEVELTDIEVCASSDNTNNSPSDSPSPSNSPSVSPLVPHSHPSSSGTPTGNSNHKLKKMGLITGIAVAAHNFPEGLATFTAALLSSKLGVVFAVAVAVHNIPEGICISMPIYFSTGSRLKGFLYATLLVCCILMFLIWKGGLSEPVGALLGYLILVAFWNNFVYSLLFGVVGGMMIFISVKELLPTALQYDPENEVVTTSCVIGMLVMALSLVLFSY